jgi:hypothetical protein
LMPELTPEPDSTDGESQKKKKIVFLSCCIYIYTLNELKLYTSNSMTVDTF